MAIRGVVFLIVCTLCTAIFLSNSQATDAGDPDTPAHEAPANNGVSLSDALEFLCEATREYKAKKMEIQRNWEENREKEQRCGSQSVPVPSRSGNVGERKRAKKSVPVCSRSSARRNPAVATVYLCLFCSQNPTICEPYDACYPFRSGLIRSES